MTVILLTANWLGRSLCFGCPIQESPANSGSSARVQRPDRELGLWCHAGNHEVIRDANGAKGVSRRICCVNCCRNSAEKEYELLTNQWTKTLCQHLRKSKWWSYTCRCDDSWCHANAALPSFSSEANVITLIGQVGGYKWLYLISCYHVQFVILCVCTRESHWGEVVSKLKLAKSPLVPVKYWRHPGGPPRLLRSQLYWVILMSKFLVPVPTNPKVARWQASSASTITSTDINDAF